MSGPSDFESPDEEIEFDIPDYGDGEVEVETAEGDEESELEAEGEPEEDAAPESEPEPEPEPEPRRNRAKERIAELARRAAEAEARAADAERRARDYESRLVTANTAQVEQAELALKSEMTIARKELIEAKTLGDYEKEAEVSIRISKLAADLSQVEAYKAQASRQVQAQPEQQYQQPQARVEPRTAAWVQANPWFDPQSPEHDPEMAVDAQAYARKLEIRLQREGRANEIGSAEYFAVIDEYVRENYPDAFDDIPAQKQPARRMPVMKTGKDVAPVGRQTSPVQAAPKKNVVRLSSDQKEIAERTFPNLPAQQAWAQYARYV